MRIPLTLSIVMICLSAASSAWAEEPSITIASEGGTQTFTASQLLARPDVASVTVPHDVSYRRSMTYRAVPLLKLLDTTHTGGKFDTLEAHAKDGFIAQIPLSLVDRGASGGA